MPRSKCLPFTGALKVPTGTRMGLPSSSNRTGFPARNGFLWMSWISSHALRDPNAFDSSRLASMPSPVRLKGDDEAVLFILVISKLLILAISGALRDSADWSDTLPLSAIDDSKLSALKLNGDLLVTLPDVTDGMSASNMAKDCFSAVSVARRTWRSNLSKALSLALSTCAKCMPRASACHPQLGHVIP